MKKKALTDYEKTIAVQEWPDFRAGDTVSVTCLIKEGEKERLQVFKGTVISRRGGGMSENFTVRKITQGHGVERVFPLQSPFVKEIAINKHGKVRRAKLFYLRDRQGRSTRIAERILKNKPSQKKVSE